MANNAERIALSRDTLDLSVVERMALRYGKVAQIYVCAMDQYGEKLTRYSGNEKEVERILDAVGKNSIDEIYHRVADSELETQAVEETSVPNVFLAAYSFHTDETALVTWIMLGIVADPEYSTLPGAFSITDFDYVTTYDKFLDTIDIVRDATELILTSKLSLYSAVAESRRSKFSEEEMKNSLRRIEAVSEVVQLLDSDDAIEVIMKSIVEILGRYLNVPMATILRIRRDSDSMDVAAEWLNNGVVSVFDRTTDIGRFGFLNADKPYIVSHDSMISEGERGELSDLGFTAVVAVPIRINNAIAMYACLFEDKPDKRWAVEDVKFVSDGVRILESILTKRIQKNSIAGSYASLEAVLDNLGSAIFVRSVEDKKILFVNRILKSTFAAELQNGTLSDLFDNATPINKNLGIYEINHFERNRWYDLRRTTIKWVDGKPASLCAAYDVTDKKMYQRRIEQQAYTDFLTGLYNRMCCERDLAMHVDSAKKNNTHGALLYLDLDDFKHINDGLGHQYGDVLLKAISHSIQHIEGIANSCYRMGGDEFVIIVPPASYDSFNKIIEEIKDIFAKPWYLKDADYYCTMSMGIVEFPDCGESVQDLIKKADIAMYDAKKSGKNRVAYYSDKIESSSNKRLDMEKNMRDATTAGYSEFEVYYQPIIDVACNGNPCMGAEALIRWNSAELGFISPGEFIPLAEYLGLINPIGNHVLLEACKTLKKWNENGHPNYKVNVNLSVVQLLQNDIVDIVRKTIEETKINPANLTLEVTESLAINDMERMKKILGAIKELGVKIALDDFGTGYSSLNHIREIPFDIIKVDQSFVRDLADDAYSQSFIKMVAELAQTIGVNICVEGIETTEQFTVLNGMKVKMVQGFYFDRPMQKGAFEAKYI